MLGKLIALSKNGEEKDSLPVVNLHFFIGSDLFCDLRINHKDIAAQHCLITSQKNKPALIRNLSRTVPTLVNNTEIGSSDVELKDNDIIAIRHKNYKWRYDSSPKPSTSSQTNFVVTSKNRKSWPLFKNKLVAVVTPHRRDEGVQMTESNLLGISQNEVPTKKRRGTIAEENIAKSKSTPKVLAIKSGLRATKKQKFGKRKSSAKNVPKTSPVERTPKVLPSLNRKSVKFLDISEPRSRLGTRGRKSSYATPYRYTPAKQKISVYSTPPSSLKHNKKKPIKSILKTPSSSSTTPRKEENDEKRLLSTSDILATPLSNVPEVSVHSPLSLENNLLVTPVKGNQPEIVMRSSRRKAALIRSPPSTPKSITKKRKSLEEKSIEASERAAKKLKKDPPYAIDKKKRAALLKCHRKSLTPHPVARGGKLIATFPSSFSSRLETNSPATIIVSPKFSNSRKSESLKSSTDLLTPTVFKYSSLGKHTDSKMVLNNTSISEEKIKPKSLNSSHKSISKTPPIVRKFTRSSRAAQISNNIPQKVEATDVLTALDLSRRWPSPSQGEVPVNSSSQNMSNLSGFKKLFSVDKTLDVRELFMEKKSESDNTAEESFQRLSEAHVGRVSRNSSLQKGNKSTDKDELMHSFQSEGAQDLPCSVSLLSGSLPSFPSYSSTSRRSLSLKGGRSISNSGNLLNITNETHKKSVDTNHFSSPLNDTFSRSNYGDCNVSQKDLNDSSSDASVFSLGSFNSSYHKSRSSDSLSLTQASDINFHNEDLEESEISKSVKDVHVSPIGGIGHSKGRFSLRRAVLLASTPKPGKVLKNNESILSLEAEGDSKGVSLLESGSNKLQLNQSRDLSSDVSGKLKKIMKKGLIAKTTSRFASLPLTTDSSILQNLSAISTSLGDLRTRRHNKVNWKELQLKSLKSSGNIINNNMNSSVTTLSAIQSTIISKSNISDHSHKEDQSEQVLTYISNISSSTRNSRQLEDGAMFNRTQIGNLSSPSKLSGRKLLEDVNATSELRISSPIKTNLGKRIRSSKHTSEAPQFMLSTSIKKRSNVPSSNDNRSTQEQALSISVDSIGLRRSSRNGNDKLILNKAHKVPSSSTPDKEGVATPIVAASSNTSVGRRGRSSKLNVGLDNSKLEKSTAGKKRSQSLPPSSDQVKPKNVPHIAEDIGHPRRKEDGSKVLNTTHIDSSPKSATMPDKKFSDRQDDVTQIIETSSNTSVARRGRSSKLNLDLNGSGMDKSTLVKKRSQSLPSSHKSVGRRGRSSKLNMEFNDSQVEKSLVEKKLSRSLPSSDDQVTPRQVSIIPEDVGRPSRSCKKDNSIVLDKTLKDSSLSTPSILLDVDSTTPIITTSLNSTGRRGRSSKLSLVGLNDSQVEKSPVVNKCSQSLPSSDEQVTPRQVSTIPEDVDRPRRSSKKDNSIVLDKTLNDSSTSTPSILLDVDSTTPIIKTSLNSTGRRGRSSKLSLVGLLNDSQVEKSPVVNKRSRSLPSSDDQVTPRQVSTIPEDVGRPRRSSKKGHSIVLNKTLNDSSSSTPSILLDVDSTTPIIKTSLNSTGRRGRSSKLSLVGLNDSQVEKSPVVNKFSRSLPSSDDRVTPRQVSTIAEDVGRPRRSSKKGHSIVLNKTLKDSSSSTPSILLDVDSTTPIIKTSLNSTGRRGRSSKLSVVGLLNDSQVKKSPVVNKRSRSLPSSDDQVTPNQASSTLNDSSHLRRSSRKGGDSKILNKINIDTSFSTLLDKTPSDEEVYATPNVSILSSLKNEIEKQGLSPKRSVGSYNSDLRKSVSPEKLSQSLSFISSKERQCITSKISVGSNNSQFEKSLTGKKRSRSLPSSMEGQTSEQVLSILERPGRPRRQSGKGDLYKIMNKAHVGDSDSSPSTLPIKAVSDKEGGASPVIKTSLLNSIGLRSRHSKLSLGTKVKNLELSVIECNTSQNLTSKTSLQPISGACSIDHIEDLPILANSERNSEKCKKRKYEEDSPESCHINPELFHGYSNTNIASITKKKVKISNTDSFPVFSDNIVRNKRTRYLDTNFRNSKTSGAFSSTPVGKKKLHLVDSCGENNQSRCKFRNMQSPEGLSPIIGNNEESSQISMVCLRHSRCPSDVEEKSKSSSFISTNKQSIEANRSHRYIDVNSSTNNLSVNISRKTTASLSATQNKLPINHETPVTSQHNSDNSLHSLHKSKKEVMKTSHIRNKTPIIKLSPGKNRTRSRKISKKMESIKEKRQNSFNHGTTFVETIIAQSSETSNKIDLSSDTERSSTHNRCIKKSLSSSKPYEQNTLSIKSPLPQRRGRPPKQKNISEIKNSINKVLPISQRRGRSAKNINLSPPLEKPEASSQKISKKKITRKTIVAEKLSSSSKKDEDGNIRNVSEKTIAENIEPKSPISVPKTRSKVAVLALKTPRKSVIISSPIVKSSPLNRRGVGKIKSENKHKQKNKEVMIVAASEDQNLEKSKRVKKKVKNSSPLILQKDIKIEKEIIISAPVKRRGRSAVNNSSSSRETLVVPVSKLDIVAEKPSVPLHKKGIYVGKSSDSSPNKRGRRKKDPVVSNKTITSPSLPNKGKPAKVQESNLSDSGKRTSRKTSESVEPKNTSLRRGRSVVQNSESSTNKRGRSKKDLVKDNGTVSSPSLSLPKGGKNIKKQDSITTAPSKKTTKKTLASAVAGETKNLRRGRSVVKDSDFSPNQKPKPKYDQVNNNEMVASPSLPKKGKLRDRVTVASSKEPNKRNSEKIEEIQTNVRRGRSAVKDENSIPDKQKRPTRQQSESDANPNLDSTVPKRGRSAKRKTRNASESKDNINTLPLQKRPSTVVNVSPVKGGKSKKGPSTSNNVTVTSPSSRKRGRPAKIQEENITAPVKGTNNKVTKNINDPNIVSSQRRGRSTTLEKDSLDKKGKLNKAVEKKSVAQTSTSHKKGRPMISENVSPRKRERTAASKHTSPLENRMKLPGRRGNLGPSPQPEIRKVSDRSKVIKKNSKIKEIRPLKSAIKQRLSRKSSLLGFIKHGRRKVHFNKNVTRNSNSRKK